MQIVGEGHRSGLARVAVALAATVVLAGCSPTTPSPTLIPLDQEHFFLPSDIAAHAPAGWTAYVTQLQLAIPYGSPVFVANQPFPDPCAGSTQQNIQCLSIPPGVELVPDGVTVGFEYQRQMLDIAPFPSPAGSGDVIMIDGFATKLVRETPGPCGAEGATETVTILIPSLGPWTGRTTVEACLRGPNLASAEAKLLAMIRATTGG